MADNPNRLKLALQRTALGNCPACGKGRLFASYLKIAPKCTHCGEEFHHHRADDAPAYFTLFIVGHIVVPILIAIEMAYTPALWIHMVIAPTLTAFLSLVLLPIIKGLVVGWQWGVKMHGFDPNSPDHDPAPR